MNEAPASPAERYRAHAPRTAHPLATQFAQSQRFDLDAFQIEACRVIEDGQSVLVAAPTGAGKTIVGEFAIHLAMLADADRAFYTTPMKALSNQKYRELQDTYGRENVGLLTGDTVVNPHARIVVMTTEVLRNMIYADALALGSLKYVVMDEVHYLADRFRGPVWEEVIIHLPQTVRLIALSATVSNAEEFGDWLETVRGDTAVIVSEHRPVPLEQHVLWRGDLIALFDEHGTGSPRVNAEIREISGGSDGWVGRSRGGKKRQSGARRARRPSGGGRLDRAAAVQVFERANLLPAIDFIFSRVGCDQAVLQLRQAGVRLTTREERDEIETFIDARVADLPAEDLEALGFFEWRSNLSRGFASHHAGLLPVFKEVVEELFQAKLVRMVFATETLALGINMPARTVLLEKLEKFNGEARVALTAGEYTQLTGRAGRRGIDVEGHAVVAWHDGLDPDAVAGLASRRTYPLRSSFRPTYNMAVNLIGHVGAVRARELLETSFAQFQADRAVVGEARKVREAERSLAGYESSVACDRGDFAEFATIRRELTDLEKRQRKDTGATAARRLQRQDQIQSLRARAKRHPCQSCPEREQHARWAERFWRLKRDIARMRRQIDQQTGSVARQFDRILAVLRDLDYVAGTGDETEVTRAGQTMQRIYGERDLLVAEALRRGVWEALDPASLAAIVSAIVFEPRQDDAVDPRDLPRGEFRHALDRTERLWAELDDLERDHGLFGTSELSAGLAGPIWRWARGESLERVLRESNLQAGDFVRWTKQVIDLLDQVSHVAPAKVRSTARSARDAVRRGVVAYATV